jgi:hypothetical protein
MVQAEETHAGEVDKMLRRPARAPRSSKGRTTGVESGLSWVDSPEFHAFSLLAAMEPTFGATGGRDGLRVSPRPSMSTLASG